MKFSVWAPRARHSVEVDLGGRRVALEPEPGGHWSVEVADVSPGTEYAFVIDGGEPLPDPRSASQPRGVHGPSQVVDLGAFPWTDADFRGFELSRAVLYELHIGTFSASGTFEGAIGHLDHLVELGVDAVELMPVVEFVGRRGWGYDGVDLFAPHHDYGGPRGLQKLIDACHARGLGVILDVVYNHLGPSGNYLNQFGPYLTRRHANSWGDGVNLDGPDSREVRRFFLDNARRWLRDYHADGLRLDAVQALVDDSTPHFLEELAREVAELAEELGRPLWLLPESDHPDPRLVLPLGRGYGLHATWADDFHHALHAVLTDERDGYYRDFGSLADLARAITLSEVCGEAFSARRARPRIRRPSELSGDRFVVSAQNHDQVGNRAQGERLSQLVSKGRLEIASALLLVSPCVPLLFQGEEWGARTPFHYFTDHDDPKLGVAVRRGRRHDLVSSGWIPRDAEDPQAPETFERSRLDWSELTRSPHAELLDWYRRLIALRRARPDLGAGRLDSIEVTHDEAARWLVVTRGGLTVAVNLGRERQRVPLSGAPRRLILENGPAELHVAAVELDPDGVALLEIEGQTSSPQTHG